jgi:LmbE family N-acetylglucosaminyl deacetylase
LEHDIRHKTILAIAAHPDDIEFMMSGTLFLLKEAGHDIHYLNIANGSCGTASLGADRIAAIRGKEAKEAAFYLGAEHHESFVNDIEIFYEKKLIMKLCAEIRRAEPDIILTQYPWEYMEDHSNTSKLVVTAAFCRGLRNFPVEPAEKPTNNKITIYHAMPYGLTDPLRKPVVPDFFVEISSVMDKKTKMLSFHKSQKEWLDVSQGFDSYLAVMADMCREVGEMSGRFEYAEGWTRHLHLGFCDKDSDPLVDVLNEYVCTSGP